MWRRRSRSWWITLELTKKQEEVFRSFLTERPKIMVASGAKRAGKTYVFILAYLAHIAKFKGKGLSFIIGGPTQAAIRRNILDDMEVILGKPLPLDKSNAVRIFGNKVYCFDGANADAWKKARGFTAAGAFLNEGTALHDSFVKEVISRCSYEGAIILMDTNPENPTHTVKTHYIDRDGQTLDNGRLNIRAFHFSLFDNDKLDPEYVESIVKATPSGMYTDRDIYGKWVAPQGVVYQDFDMHRHYIDRQQASAFRFVKYFAGVDWGYEHAGSIVVCGKTQDGTTVLLEEHSAKHQEIDYWVDVAKRTKERYGNIAFYCDSARPEHVQRFQREQINAINANKSVLSGIETVAKGFKTDKLYVVKDAVDLFKVEIYQYVWNEKTGEPMKVWDDSLDALRYAIYSEASLLGFGASARLY